jgi:hypothetical protein
MSMLVRVRHCGSGREKKFMTLNARLELKIKELESKLELEQTTRGRMETQVTGGLYYKHNVTVNDTSRVRLG